MLVARDLVGGGWLHLLHGVVHGHALHRYLLSALVMAELQQTGLHLAVVLLGLGAG